jgi:hypothetical protein
MAFLWYRRPVLDWRKIMWLSTWLKQRPSKRSVSSRRPRARFLPRLEALEDRWLPSTLMVTNANDSGNGSLRGQIAAASDGDTIKFSGGLKDKTITLTSGEIAFDIGLDIEGLGATQLTISGNNNSRIFHIGPDASAVTIAGLTIKDGQVANTLDFGGAILDDGASLNLTADTLSNNHALDGGALDVFGGYTAGMTVTITNCKFVSNGAVGPAGSGATNGGFAEGGAILVDPFFSSGLRFTATGTSFLQNSATAGAGAGGASVSDGGAGVGGAIAIEAFGSGGGGFQLTKDTFSGDTATGGAGGTPGAPLTAAKGGNGGFAEGGAVWIDGFLAGQPTFGLSTDTFVNCHAIGGSGGNGLADPGGNGGDVGGGAIFYTANFAASPTLIVNQGSTFTLNTAQGGNGGVGGNSGTASPGGTGGSSFGGAVEADYANSAGASDSFTGDSFQTNYAIGGAGGTGGTGGIGGTGGQGGDAEGSGLLVIISGSASGTQLAIANSGINGNTARAGNGGNGGIGVLLGGNGGLAGSAVGGGLFLGFDPGGKGAFDAWTLTADTVAFNVCTGGNGGGGGLSTFVGGNGGDGGVGDGGGAFNDFLGKLEILQCTISNNTATSGAGGTGGAGSKAGTNGGKPPSGGGGFFTIETACESSNTHITGNYADVAPDVAGTLVTC